MESNRLIREALADMEPQRRLEKRVERILHKIEGWDRDELAKRYAWLLLLACKLNETARLLRKTSSLKDSRAQWMKHFLDQSEPLVEEAFKTRNDRKRGAVEMLARDPKQAAKKEAFKMWQDWQANRTRYASGADFARHVLDEQSALKNVKSVEAWVTKWRREAKGKNTH